MTIFKEEFDRLIKLHDDWLNSNYVNGRKLSIIDECISIDTFRFKRLCDIKITESTLLGIISNCTIQNSIFTYIKFEETYFLKSSFILCDMKNNDFTNSILNKTSFDRCDLKNCKFPDPFVLLKCNWGELSDKLTAICMAIDAHYHPNGVKLFNAWAKGGPCPYYNSKFNRIINFNENKDLWNPSLIKKSFNIYDILRKLFKEKQCTINF